MNRFVIVVIAFDRPASLGRLLAQLITSNYNNQEVDLVISIDKGPSQENLIKICENHDWVHGTLKIIAHEQNLGLKKHVLKCGDLVADYDAIIMLEDDIFPSTSLFSFTEKAIRLSSGHENIAGISLYTPSINEFTSKKFIPIFSTSDLFLAQVPQSWGQVWSKNMWFSFREWLSNTSLDCSIDDRMPLGARCWSDKSWKKLFFHYMVVMDKYFIYPSVSLSTNFYEVGTHVKRKSTLFQVPLSVTETCHDLALPGTQFIYDSHYENNYLQAFLQQRYVQKVVVDLYGSKEIELNVLLLTTRRLPYKIVYSYGLELKPHELNVLWNVEGNLIYLYDTSKKSNVPAYSLSDEVKLIKYYELNDWRSSLKIVINDLYFSLRSKLKL